MGDEEMMGIDEIKAFIITAFILNHSFISSISSIPDSPIRGVPSRSIHTIYLELLPVLKKLSSNTNEFSGFREKWLNFFAR